MDVAVATDTVALGRGVAGAGVTVGRLVWDGRGVNVAIAVAVGVTGVRLARGVTDGIGEAVGVMNMGLPNSLHPKSGAAPVKPVIGVGGMGSPLFAINCVTPLSIAGEPDWSKRPLKSSSTVSHAPSGPGFGAA